jgi:hypothetical protein
MGLGAEIHAEVMRRRLGHEAPEVERQAAEKLAALVDAGG